MPYRITWEPHGACRRFWGFVSFNDIRLSFKELHDDQRYDSLLYILHDHSEMTGRDWNVQNLAQLGATHLGAAFSNNRLQDIVVTTDDEFAAILSTHSVATLLPKPIEFFPTLAQGRARVEEILQQRAAATEAGLTTGSREKYLPEESNEEHQTICRAAG